MTRTTRRSTSSPSPNGTTRTILRPISSRSGEKTGHDFDGWYQTTKDFGNTNKRVTKLNMAKKWELVGKLTRKEYTVTASLFLNGSEEATRGCQRRGYLQKRQGPVWRSHQL